MAASSPVGACSRGVHDGTPFPHGSPQARRAELSIRLADTRTVDCCTAGFRDLSLTEHPPGARNLGTCRAGVFMQAVLSDVEAPPLSAPTEDVEVSVVMPCLNEARTV